MKKKRRNLFIDTKTKHSLRNLIWEEVRKQGWRFLVYFFVIACAGAFTVIPPKFYGYFVENVGGMQTLNSVSASEFLHKLFYYGLIIACGLFISNFLRAVSEEWISLRIEASLRCRFMSFMHKMPFEGFDESQRGDWLTRMSTDIRSVEQFIALRLPNQISDAMITVAIASMFLIQNVSVACFLIISSIGLATVNVYLQGKLTPILDHLRNLHGEVFQGLLENFEGLRSIRSYRAERFVLRNFTVRVQSIIERGLHLIRRVGLLIGSNSFIVNLLTAIALCFVALKLRHNEVLLSDVFLYPFYMGMFYTSVFALVRSVFDWNDFIVHANRLDEVFRSDSSEAYRSGETFSKLFDSLDIKNAVIAYKGFSKLTKPFDFKIQLGETVVVRGHSGCGKSTFLESLAGLRQIEAQSAQLYNDGHTVETFPVKQDKVCFPVDLGVYVEQRPYLLESSLRNNLLFGEQSQSDETLWSALESVHLERFFQERDGLDFKIKDNGRNLSEGQKQRIGIARALVHLRPLLLLDEPFASLDHESVDALCKKLNSLRPHHGIVIVTHTIPEALTFDRVVDFDMYVNPHAAKECDTEEVSFGDTVPLRHLVEAPFRTATDCIV
jgi:ABC-type multidrug transport system fused ATPase/permease subunit